MAFWPYLFNQSLGAGSQVGSFFGEIEMLREFWVEDPSWTPPSDGQPISTAPLDNGTFAANLSIYETPFTYWVSDPNTNRPYLEIPAAALMRNAASQIPSGTFSVIVVGSSANLSSYGSWAQDGKSTLWKSGVNRAGFRLINDSVDIQGGEPYQNLQEAVVYVYGTNNHAIYVNDDPTPVVSKTDGTVNPGTGGIAVNGRYIGSLDRLSGGRVSYLAMYDGDITQHPQYSNWITSLVTHYNINNYTSSIPQPYQFVGSEYSVVDASSYTFNSGYTFTDGGLVVIGVNSRDNGNSTPAVLNSLTVNGSSATIHAQVASGFNQNLAAITSVVVPPNTTLDPINVVFNTGLLRCGINVWVVPNFTNNSPAYAVASNQFNVSNATNRFGFVTYNAVSWYDNPTVNYMQRDHNEQMGVEALYFAGFSGNTFKADSFSAVGDSGGTQEQWAGAFW